ncbi:MAG: basic amino acid ABC transporter substrate-binding protein [Mogibacterium sp.]|nr:basic amino acid ABC transporter substrate-binding protein [Mogibacterium sp.]
MKAFKKYLAMILGAAMIFTLAACGGGADNSAETDDSSDSEAQVLRVVTEATFAPFESTDEDTGEIIGFDPDMMAAIAEDQGLTLEWINMEFDSLIPAVNSNQGDIICAGMNKLAGDRAQMADFGDTYFESDLMLLVKSDSDLSGIDAVTSDMKLASQIGTTGGDMVQEMKEEGKIADSVVLNQWTDCYLQLQNGEVQGVIVDKPVGEAYLKSHGDIAKFAGESFGDHEEFAFAVKKGNTELLDKLNAGLANIKASGKYEELVDKWFS